MTEEKNIISIDGTDFKEDDLSTRHQYLIRHIKDLQMKIAAKKFELEPLDAAMVQFTNTLLKEIKDANDDG
mgnify:FL=1